MSIVVVVAETGFLLLVDETGEIFEVRLPSTQLNTTMHPAFCVWEPSWQCKCGGCHECGLHHSPIKHAPTFPIFLRNSSETQISLHTRLQCIDNIIYRIEIWFHALVNCCTNSYSFFKLLEFASQISLTHIQTMKSKWGNFEANTLNEAMNQAEEGGIVVICEWFVKKFGQEASLWFNQRGKYKERNEK